MDSNYKLGFKQEGTPIDTGRYQHLVRKLMYLSHTSPDIVYPISVVSQFINKLNQEHLKAVYRILWYLKMTLGKGLFFK